MKPDGGYSSRNVAPERAAAPIRVEKDTNVTSDADTVLAFRGMRVSSAVAMCLITSAASVVGTYIVSHQGQSANCASPADVAAVDKHVSELAQTVHELATQTIPRNADQAHNDTQGVATEFRAYVASHAK